ncbi:MAG: hypothetical protein M0Q95_00090 [Porticoccaceae bacterium]|nr:hypothetical protein [Porticoccaceae bacterium]
MAITIDPLADGNLAALDNALWKIFNLTIEPCKCSASLLKDEDRFLAVQVAWRGLLLGREFFQAAGVPVFDPGYIGIAEHKVNGGQWRIGFGVPNIDHIDALCYRVGYGGAMKMVALLMTSSLDDGVVKHLRDTASKQVITTMRRMTMSGKSTIPVLKAAHQMNLPFLHLGGGVYQLGWGSQSRKVDRSSTDADANLGTRLTQNKLLTAGVLRMAGLPAPVHSMVGSAKAGIRFAHNLGWPVVVKPADSDRGEGVSVGIRSDEELTTAFDQAKKASPRKQVIVEREVPGVCHRLFVANGQLLYAVKRLPKSVAGDGIHTVAQLIVLGNNAENAKPPWLRSEPFPDDELAVKAMADAGFFMDSIPRDGELVPLRIIESTADGGVDEDVTHCIHPDNLCVALRAAELFNLSVAGIDIISTDITRSWTETGAIINEVNFSPLLGGAAISKSHVPEFLRRMVGNNGRIPVDVFVGAENALASASARQAELVAAGASCYLTSHILTLDPSGSELRLQCSDLYQRCRALLMDRQVERIVLVIQTDELFKTGLPVDRISSLSIERSEQVRSIVTEEPLSPEKFRRLVGFLENLGDAK